MYGTAMKNFPRVFLFFKFTVTALFTVLSNPSFGQDEMPKSFSFLKDIDPTIIQDIRYATSQNFTGEPLPGYEAAECILATPVAKALKHVQVQLKKQGFSLKVYDCYRPRRAVRAFVRWAKNKKDSTYTKLYFPSLNKQELFSRGFIALPSDHSKGVAVDLSMVSYPPPFTTSVSDDKYGPCNGPAEKRIPDNSVDMGTSWDCFDERSHTFSNLITDEQRRLRKILIDAMKQQGFDNYSKEWWHFTLAYPEYTKYHDFTVIKKKRFWFW